MAQEEKWEPFTDVVEDDNGGDDDDEALSLSDLPDNLSDNNNSSTSSSRPAACNPHTTPDSPAADFEFRISFGGETTSAAAAAAAAEVFAADMCAADEVFFRGQLLPLRPSLSSSSSSSSSESSALFRSGSLSDSLDRSASSAGLSSRGSSGCVSRSPSSSSGADAAAAPAPPRLSASANYLLYALPSPSPQIRRKGGAGPGAPSRRSTGSHGPGIFRLGVARAPGIIELRDLRMRSRSHADAAARDGRKSLGGNSSCSNSHSNNNNNSIGGSFRLLFPGNRGNEQKAAGRRSTRAAAGSFMGRGFGCSCAPDAVEPVINSPIAASSRKKPMKKEEEEEKEEERRGLKRGESMCRRRILEWMEELSIGKVLVG